VIIIIDLNQVVYSSLTIQAKHSDLDENLIRHVTLNTLRLVRNKFFDKYGEIIIACDNKHYWRRDVFPYYKANRKKDREASTLNWPLIFDCMNKVKEELKQTFPYRFIDVDGAEADDIVSVLIEELPYNERALIISGDKDFIQLHTMKPYIDQYEPIRKKWITHPNPGEYLKEHIIRGDRSDGVPNIRTPDSSLATGERQKTVSSKMMDSWLEDGIPRELQRNFERNKTLIDLTQIPEHIKTRISAALRKEPEGNRNKLYSYFIDKRLRNLMENINEF